MSDEWISVKERLPEVKDGEDNSENCLVICNGRLMVMAYCYIDCGEDSGYAWCNCNGDINGDPEFDDNYNPTHWMPLPKLMPINQQTPPKEHWGLRDEKREIINYNDVE